MDRQANGDGMRIEITRRELAAGFGGIAAAGWMGLPAFGMDNAPVPLPPACSSGGIEPYIIDEVHELHRVACAEWGAYARFAQTGEGGSGWSSLYVRKVDAGAALRGRLGHLTSDERALRDWLAAIYRTKLSAVARCDELPKISPSMKGPASEFQKHLLRLPFPPPASGHGRYPVPPAAVELERIMKAAREAAWAVLGIAPRSVHDAALHRRAAMFAVDPNVGRFLEARWAGIEAARLDEGARSHG